MNSENECAAVVQMGWLTQIYEGDDFYDIIDQIKRVQDFDCLIFQSQGMGTSADRKVAQRLEDWVYRIQDEKCDMHHFDEMNFELSIGEIKCLGWAQGEDECQALREKFKDICE